MWGQWRWEAAQVLFYLDTVKHRVCSSNSGYFPLGWISSHVFTVILGLVGVLICVRGSRRLGRSSAGFPGRKTSVVPGRSSQRPSWSLLLSGNLHSWSAAGVTSGLLSPLPTLTPRVSSEPSLVPGLLPSLVRAVSGPVSLPGGPTGSVLHSLQFRHLGALSLLDAAVLPPSLGLCSWWESGEWDETRQFPIFIKMFPLSFYDPAWKLESQTSKANPRRSIRPSFWYFWFE